MVLRGFGRNPRRSISTVVGIVLALTLVLTSWGLLDTTEILISQQFNHVQLEDAQIVPEHGVDASLLESIRRVTGVQVAEQVSALDVSLSGPKGSYSTQLLAFPSGTVMHAFDSPGGGPQPGGDRCRFIHPRQDRHPRGRAGQRSLAVAEEAVHAAHRRLRG